MSDLIDRQEAIKAVSEYGSVWMEYTRGMTKDEIAQRALNNAKATMIRIVKELPSAQPEPLSDAYMKAVWAWLLNYQVKAAELKGRYTPYEVLSWVANDWRREHETD